MLACAKGQNAIQNINKMASAALLFVWCSGRDQWHAERFVGALIASSI